MNRATLMKNPFYASILYKIESRIGSVDREAKSRDLSLTDSQIRSVLNKVRKCAGGGKPEVPAGSERERLLASLVEDLVRLPVGLQVENGVGEIEDLAISDWVLSLRTVEDSIRLHSSGQGSRQYLEFLIGFLAEANGRSKTRTD